MRTTVINNNTTVVRNKVVVVHDYYDSYWGPGYYGGGYGFYSGDSFWSGYMWGSLMSHNYNTQPVYIYSPTSGVQVGQLAPPTGQTGFQSDSDVQRAVLDVMSKGDPSGTDTKAGLYMATDNFNPDNPGDKISAPAAYNALKDGKSIFFHPPNGAFEKITNFNDLQSYAYSKEAKTAAPQQEVVKKESHTLRNVLIGTAVVGGAAAGGYWLYKRSKKDDW